MFENHLQQKCVKYYSDILKQLDKCDLWTGNMIFSFSKLFLMLLVMIDHDFSLQT